MVFSTYSCYFFAVADCCFVRGFTDRIYTQIFELVQVDSDGEKGFQNTLLRVVYIMFYDERKEDDTSIQKNKKIRNFMIE